MSRGAHEPFDRLIQAAALMIHGDADDPPWRRRRLACGLSMLVATVTLVSLAARHGALPEPRHRIG